MNQQIKPYCGDEVLKRLGVFSNEKRDPLRGFITFMILLKSEDKVKYTELHEEVKAVSIGSSANTAENVLAKYLFELGSKVIEQFYETSIIFIRLYKECLNEYGWELISKERKISREERKRKFSKEEGSANYIPDMCNDFIKYYLPKEFPDFDKYFAAELVRHLCNWINKEGYTKKTIMLM